MRRSMQMQDVSKISSTRPQPLTARRTVTSEFRAHSLKGVNDFPAKRSKYRREKDSEVSSVTDRKGSNKMYCTNNRNEKCKTKLSNQGYTYGRTDAREIENQVQTYPHSIYPKVYTNTNNNPESCTVLRQDDSVNDTGGPTFGIVNILHEISHTGRKATLQDLLAVTEEGNKNFSRVVNVQSTSSASLKNEKQLKHNSVEHFVVQKQTKKVGMTPVKVRHLSTLKQFDIETLNDKEQLPQDTFDENNNEVSSGQETSDLSLINVDSSTNTIEKLYCYPEEPSNTSKFSSPSHRLDQNVTESISNSSCDTACSIGNDENGSKYYNKKSRKHDSTKEECCSCKTLLQKLRSQQLSYKNIKKENGTLENIITQKRTLVEQLTKQVKYLVKEYHQLAQFPGGTPAVDETSLSNILNSVPKNGNDTSLSTDGIVTVAEILRTANTPIPVTTIVNNMNTHVASGENTSANANNLTTTEIPEKKHSVAPTVADVNNNHIITVSQASVERIKELENQLCYFRQTCRAIQEQLLTANKDNLRNKAFLSDLLYTLSVRGYETVTEHNGKEIDLRRIKGEQLLNLKGKDCRLKVAPKRSTPQDMFMKAVIGSQERAIQTLVQQLESHERDIIVGNILSSQPNTVKSEESVCGHVLEAEIFSLVNILEGACQRNSDVLKTLQEVYFADTKERESSGVKANTQVLEIVLERCQEIVSSNTPTASPSRAIKDGDAKSAVSPQIYPSPRSLNPSNEITSDQLDIKSSSVKVNLVQGKNLNRRSSYYPQHNKAPKNVNHSFGVVGKGAPTNVELFPNESNNSFDRTPRRHFQGVLLNTSVHHLASNDLDPYEFEFNMR